jgi:predicted transcriptional regulator
MRVSEAMSRDCQAVRSNQSLREAAQQMRDHDIGMLFVNDDQGRVAGLITDRDIAVRAVAEGRDANSQVSDFMTRDVLSCYEDSDLEEAVQLMEEQQVRRLLICNRSDEPIGVLAQADVAQALGRAPLTGEALREISKPGGRHSQSPH